MTDLSIKKKMIGIDCKHAFYSVDKENRHDMVLVKEYQHFDDGSVEMNFRLLKDFKRPFWITKPGYRTHVDKKEWEDIDKLDKYECTQVDLSWRISQILKINHPNPSLRNICNNPFIYGADISTTSIIKQYYKDKFPEIVPKPATVAALDIETDVVNNTGLINIISIVQLFGNVAKVYAAVSKWYCCNHPDYEADVIKKTVTMLKNMDVDSKNKESKKLKEKLEKLEFDIEIVQVDNGGDGAYMCIQKLHEWKPDFVSIWNIDFDLPKIIKELEDNNYNLADVFSDPCVPEEFRSFRYVEGMKMKITDSGKKVPLSPTEVWNRPIGMSSFQFIDSMVFYKRLRIAKGNEPGYGLDAVLQRRLGARKLKFEDLVPYTSGLSWHVKMQLHYIAEYCVYNIWDSLSLLFLDQVLGDINTSYPIVSGITDHANFTSNPRIIGDAMHYFALKNNLVIGTTGSDMTTPLDEGVVGTRGWIRIMPTYLVHNNGMQVLEGTNVRSMIRAHLSDIDVEATYPSVQIFMNISKETTHRELTKIEGINYVTRQALGFNMTGGVVNALEIGETCFKVRPLEDWLEAFDREHSNAD